MHYDYTYHAILNLTQQPTLSSHNQSFYELEFEVSMYHPATPLSMKRSTSANYQANATTPFSWFVNLHFF